MKNVYPPGGGLYTTYKCELLAHFVVYSYYFVRQ
jgi:hypothetical protein